MEQESENLMWSTSKMKYGNYDHLETEYFSSIGKIINSYFYIILLKSLKKTPLKEITKANNNLKDFLERNGNTWNR